MSQITGKRLYIIVVLLFIASKAYSCPACWGKYNSEEIDFRKSNQPENISEKIKKYFPQKENDKTENSKSKCKDPNDKKCKNPEDQQKTEKQDDSSK